MRIAVFSDSHGDLTLMREVTGAQAPDAVFHLGDYAPDARQLHETFPDIPLYAVAGNNDYGDPAPLTLTLELEGVKLVLTHGHRFGVHAGPDRLAQYAAAQGARAALFGHTHATFCEQRDGIWLLNPGRAGRGLFSFSAPTCALLTLERGSLRWDPIDGGAV